MGTVVMYSSVSVDGFVADENDQPGPHEMLTLLEEELMRRLCETAGLGLVRHTSSVIAATSGRWRSAT